MDDWLNLLIRLAFAAAILGLAWLFCRQWKRWMEAREEASMSEQQPVRKIGHTPFTDGVAREVFEDCDGRQYILDDTDERVYGQWLPLADEPHATGGDE
jgi:hypothetical protein